MPWDVARAALALAVAKSSNFQSRVRHLDAGRHGGSRPKPPDMIVWHATEGGSLDDAITWVDRVLNTGETPSSFHYGIAVDGTIVRLVHPDFIAWHAGRSSYPGRQPAQLGAFDSVNARSVGIEFTTIDTDASELAAAQLESGYWLAKVLKAEYPTIRIHQAHREVAPGRKTDPLPSVLPMMGWRADIYTAFGP